jgi:hypothetical protein
MRDVLMRERLRGSVYEGANVFCIIGYALAGPMFLVVLLRSTSAAKLKHFAYIMM